MRCRRCDQLLDDGTLTKKNPKTGEWEDLCYHCSPHDAGIIYVQNLTDETVETFVNLAYEKTEWVGGCGSNEIGDYVREIVDNGVINTD